MTSPQAPTPGPISTPSAVAPVIPTLLTMPAAPRSGLGAFFAWLGKLVLALTTLLNLSLLAAIVGGMVYLFGGFEKESGGTHARYYGGEESAQDRIAVIRIEGVLFEGFTGYARQQIDAVAQDDQVKAIVLRIVSPGGTITASDDLHKRLNDLRAGRNVKHPGKPKPIVVSMGSIAASGGYYIAMIKSTPPTVIYAEPGTITGSIGVYAALPNVAKMAEKYGFEMNVIKAGDLKYSGSMFKTMDPKGHEVWQNYVDHAYLRFLDVIGEARGQLTRAELQNDVDMSETLPVREGTKKSKHFSYQRYRADGGMYLAEQALRLQLIDHLGYLDDAIKEAARQAGLGEDYKVITYDRPAHLLGSLLGIKEGRPGLGLAADQVAAAAAPRLWYLAPQHELAGWLTALGH